MVTSWEWSILTSNLFLQSGVTLILQRYKMLLAAILGICGLDHHPRLLRRPPVKSSSLQILRHHEHRKKKAYIHSQSHHRLSEVFRNLRNSDKIEYALRKPTVSYLPPPASSGCWNASPTIAVLVLLYNASQLRLTDCTIARARFAGSPDYVDVDSEYLDI